MFDETFCVFKHCWPVEAGSESFGDKGSTASVVSAGSLMYVSEQLNSVFGCNASLEDSGCSLFEELAIDDGE
jgi:hypothetical protein